MSMKQSLREILTDFSIYLAKEGVIAKEDVTLGQIHDAADKYIERDGFIYKAHYYLCDCQREEATKDEMKDL